MEDKKKDIYFYGRTRGRVDGKYRFLSNFYKSSFILDDNEYSTVEHYFQSKKHESTDLEEKIRLAVTPGMAKKLAWQKDPLLNWENIKDDIMLKALRAKFSQNPKLKLKLLETGNAELHEESPSDMYWGIKGKDKLGKLLMLIRKEFLND